MTTFTGTSGNDSFTGTSAADIFNLQQGGNDTADGLAGNDLFNMGATLNAADRIDGGDGNDTVALDGDYSVGLTFAAATMVNVETLLLAAGNSYKLTTNDSTVAVGAVLTVDGSALGAGDSLTFNGSHETNGSLTLTGGAGDDVLTGGTYSGPSPLLGNTFDLSHGGDDSVTGGLNVASVVDFGATLTAADRVTGRGNTTILLDGDYTGSRAVTMNATTMVDVNTLKVSAGHSYTLASGNASLPNSHMLIDGSALGAGDVLHFDGSAQTTGVFDFIGGAGNDVLVDSSGDDLNVGSTFDLSKGGNDTVVGGPFSDTFEFGAAFTAADQVDGGTPDEVDSGNFGGDEVVLDGNYAGTHAVTLGTKTMVNIERLTVAAGHSYTLTTNDATVAAGKILQVDGSALVAGNVLTFNGGAETDGAFSITGGAANDVLTGGAGADYFDLSEGGSDTVHGGAGNDEFHMGRKLNAGDAIDGGAGFDFVDLDGDYSAGVTFSSTTLRHVEELVLAPGHSYKLTTADGTVSAGTSFTVDAAALVAGNNLNFDGSAETNGSFDVFAGAGNDIIRGGAGADSFDLSKGGSDTVHGGAGDDVFDLGGKLNAGDAIDGGAGHDTVNLDGNYSGGVTFSSTTLRNVESLVLGTGHSYKLTTADGTVSAGKTLAVHAGALAAGNNLNFDGSAETNGSFRVTAGAGNDTIRGGAGADSFDLRQGGNDTIRGGAGDDLADFGTHFNASDFFNGGGGDDTLRIDKAYAANIVLSNVKNIEELDLSDDNYHITTTDGVVSAGSGMLVELAPDTVHQHTLWFDGSAETNGGFAIDGVDGRDHIRGGAMDDFIEGHGGADFLRGGGGHDTYLDPSVSDSTSKAYDTIYGFNANGNDLLVLESDHIAGVNATIAHGSLSGATFDSDLAAAVNAGHLLTQHAALFTPDAGSHAGQTFLIVDANHQAGYQAGADYVIRLENPQNIGQLSADSFATFTN